MNNPNLQDTDVSQEYLDEVEHGIKEIEKIMTGKVSKEAEYKSKLNL